MLKGAAREDPNWFSRHHPGVTVNDNGPVLHFPGHALITPAAGIYSAGSPSRRPRYTQDAPAATMETPLGIPQPNETPCHVGAEDEDADETVEIARTFSGSTEHLLRTVSRRRDRNGESYKPSPVMHDNGARLSDVNSDSPMPKQKQPVLKALLVGEDQGPQRQALERPQVLPPLLP